MRAYTVHAPPGDVPAAGPERIAFVKDGFCWPALFFPIPWILWHRLWLALVWFIVAMLVLAWAERLGYEDIALVLGMLGAVLFALEANNIRRLSLQSRGWRELGGSHGKSLEEAEIRFFEALSTEPAASRTRRDPSRAERHDNKHIAGDEPIFGLFPEPER